MIESLIAALATLLGAMGLKLFEWLLNRRTETLNKRDKINETIIQSHIREVNALKDELNRLRIVIDETENEMHEWREKYWMLREQHVEKISDLLASLDEMPSDDDKD